MKKHTIAYDHITGPRSVYANGFEELRLALEKLDEDDNVSNHTISINTIEPPVPALPPDTRNTDGVKFKSDIAPVRG